MAKVCAFLLFVTMNDENIIFEEVAPNGQQTQPSAVFKSPIPGNYTDLFTELKEKCDPAHFINPYDPEKVDKANTIYSELLAANPNDMAKMKEFRRRAMDELEVKFATKKLYDRLILACNPSRFTGKNYDNKKLTKANTLYRKILENADNVFGLEELETVASDLLQSYPVEVQQIKDYGSGRIVREDEDYSFLQIFLLLFCLIFGFILFVVIASA